MKVLRLNAIVTSFQGKAQQIFQLHPMFMKKNTRKVFKNSNLTNMLKDDIQEFDRMIECRELLMWMGDVFLSDVNGARVLDS